MENNSTPEEVKSEPSGRQQPSGADDGRWWSRFKALGHGLLEAVGLRKKNKNPLGEHSESCHLGGEPDHLATQYKHYLLEKLGLTSKDVEEEPSPPAEAQERLEFIE
ncbi:uncharacterized protein LOC124314297 [Daphnia pulicaria]|uniref:uncharacterized protein LOC124314297 n=1 Tax=Daphnia pulicaria TaxID=35523 RepID=UPI001EECD8A3|nr:uncharacterized protein LOC124314297 [Daphnia pulicaria]